MEAPCIQITHIRASVPLQGRVFTHDPTHAYGVFAIVMIGTRDRDLLHTEDIRLIDRVHIRDPSLDRFSKLRKALKSLIRCNSSSRSFKSNRQKSPN